MEGNAVAARKVHGLAYSPPVAKALGAFVAEFASLEMVLPVILARLINISNENANSIMNSIESIEVRRSIIVNCLNSTETVVKDKLHAWLSEVKGVITKRNKYVHGTYIVDIETYCVVLNNNVYSNREDKSISVTKETIDADTNRIRTIIHDTLYMFSPDADFSHLLLKDMPPPPD